MQTKLCLGRRPSIKRTINLIFLAFCSPSRIRCQWHRARVELDTGIEQASRHRVWHRGIESGIEVHRGGLYANGGWSHSTWRRGIESGIESASSLCVESASSLASSLASSRRQVWRRVWRRARRGQGSGKFLRDNGRLMYSSERVKRR